MFGVDYYDDVVTAIAQVLYSNDNLEVRGGMRYDDFSDFKDSWTGY